MYTKLASKECDENVLAKWVHFFECIYVYLNNCFEIFNVKIIFQNESFIITKELSIFMHEKRNNRKLPMPSMFASLKNYFALCQELILPAGHGTIKCLIVSQPTVL